MQKLIRGLFILAVAGLAAHNVRAAALTGKDVGTPSNPGSVTTAADGKITIVGGGSDIWNASDNCYYAYYTVTGDFDYVAKVDSLVGNTGDGGWSKIELMARIEETAGTGPQGPDPFIANMTTRPSSDTPTTGSAATGAAGVNYRGPQWRVNRGGNADWRTPAPVITPNMPNNWVRLERVGTVVYMYWSNDGKTWSMYNPYSPQGWDTAGSYPAGADNATAFPGYNITGGTSADNAPWPNTIFVGLAVTAHSDPDTTTAVVSYFGPYTNGSPVAIVTQPVASISIPANSPLDMSVVASGDPVHYQWRKDGTAVSTNGLGAAYHVDLAKTTDSGTYTVRVYGAGKEVISGNVVVTVTQDVTPPTIVKVTGDALFTTLTVEFSEPVTDTALTASNYKLDKGITVSSVARSSDRKVTLNTSKMAEGTDYTLTVNNVLDTATPANKIATDSTFTFLTFKFQTGWASYERWASGTASPGDEYAFLAALDGGTVGPPVVSSASTTFECPWGVADYYWARTYGYFIPPSNGNYVFFTDSDDHSLLYLSTDENPANKKLIAHETQWSNQYQFTASGGASDLAEKRSDQSTVTEWPTGNTITLQAGKRYWMEVLLQEGNGGDGATVTFIKEGDADPSNDSAGMHMLGSVIATYLDPNGASATFSKQPQNATVQEGRKGTFTTAATGTSAYGTTVSYQWQKAAKGSSTFTDIAGATATTYKTAAVTSADDGTQYRVVAMVPTLAVNSDVATLTVVPDTFPPVPSAGGIVNTNGTTIDVGIGFDEPVDPAAASLQANYVLTGGTLTGFTWYTNSQSVILKVTGLAAGGTGTVTVKNVKDPLGNAISATGVTVPFTVSTKMKWGVVGGQEGWDGATPSQRGNWVVPVAADGFDVYSDGRTEWNNYDETTFVYEEITGDFDKKVRVEYQDQSSQWARAGLVMREVTNFGVGSQEQISTLDDGSAKAEDNNARVSPDGKAGRYQKCHVNPVGPTMTGPGTSGNGSWEGNRRLIVGGPSSTAGGGGVPLYPDAWCRIQRQGQLFSIYRSDDGINWTLNGTTTFDPVMPDKVFVGPEFSPENGNITNPEDRGVWLAKFREYGDTFGVTPGKPTLSATVAADGKVTLTYTGTLVSSDTVNGTYAPVTGAASPYTVDPKAASKPATFYQSKQ